MKGGVHLNNLYISYGDIQKYIKNYYFQYNKKTTVAEALKGITIIQSKRVSHSTADKITLKKSWSYISDEEFLIEIYNLMFPYKEPADYFPTSNLNYVIPELGFFPKLFDVLVFRQFQNIEDPIHSHNFFEIFYVYKGSCTLRFEEQVISLEEGNLFIIAPDSKHSMIHDDESTIIITICLRKSTFDSSFFKLLTYKDLLSSFFRTILYNKKSSNYILFFTDNSEEIKLIIRNLMFEYNRGDFYSNECCISWINLMFSFILRNYSDKVQFYNYDLSADFYSIMKYIQSNYRNLTLNSLAKVFHYSEAYMSFLIKKNTGLRFMKLITGLKMSDACEYLKNTNITIEKISELIGYNSSDHFSRTFKKYYDCSPYQYRQKFILEK